jgi:tight adherence protein C
MSRWLAASAVALWAGATLVLAELRWFRREPLVQRLRPYSPGGLSTGASAPGGASLQALVLPLARGLGEGLARLVGVQEDVALRLRRLHAPLDAGSFRLRQLAWAGAGLGLGTVLAAATQPPVAIAALFLLGGPVLAFLLVEQQLSTASARRQRRTFLELPIMSEQLGMLIGAGYSLGTALNRLASRGSGACAEDLAIVCGRIRQGLGEIDALREWAAVADVGALTRLVAVLALNREAGDLGRLIAEEARSIRRDVQRELIEQIERRGQQVWIPVTVATLVPGAVLLAIPFIEALRLFSSS